MNNKEIESLIKELIKYDNESGYELEAEEVKNKLKEVTKKLIDSKENCLSELHPLLEDEETWSCLFTLKILKEIKSKKSIPYLIDFIKVNEDGDYWECYDIAMFALIDIGNPAVELLSSTIKSDFNNKKYPALLIEALGKIKDDRVYSFMIKITKDFIENYEEYEEWFQIDHFTYGFDTQERKEAIPLLKKLLAMKDTSESDKIEIKSTIEVIEDPVGYKKKIAEQVKLFKETEEKAKTKTKAKKISRNEPCPCGSGKKYKKCCLKNSEN